MEQIFNIQNRYSFNYEQGMVIEYMTEDLNDSDIGIVKLHRGNYVELESGISVNKGLIYKVKENYAQKISFIPGQSLGKSTNLCI